jgi:Fic family protein
LQVLGSSIVEVSVSGGSPIGSLIPIAGVDGRTGRAYAHYGFAPVPLSDTPPLSGTAWAAVAAASHAMGRLKQGEALVPNPALLRRPTLRREAQSTSALEGTYAPLDEVLAADVVDEASKSPALREVMNFGSAAEQCFAWLAAGRPLTVGLVTQLHRTLVAGTAADNDDAGRIRQRQVVIGSRGDNITDARFVPMPNGAPLEAGVADLVNWMRPSDHADVTPIVAAALSHYQFETLHPFNDGNGRLGRLLIVAQLMTDELIGEGLLSVSPWFERRREEYQDHLAAVSATGDWSPWVTFFANGLQASAKETAERLGQLLDLQRDYISRVRGAGRRGVIEAIEELLIGQPYVTVPWLASETSKTYQAVSNAVAALEELGILYPLPETYPQAWVAREVLRIA